MAFYPMPTNNQTQDITSFFGYVNTLTDGLFFAMLMMVIWVIIFIASKQYDTPRAWTAASLICSFLAVPLSVGGLLAPWIMYMLFVFSAGGLLWLKLDKG